MAKSSVVYEGIEYRSLNALAKAYNIELKNLVHRLSKGYALDKALDNDKLNRQESYFEHKWKKMTYEGVEYKSCAELARAYGLRPNLLYKRLFEQNMPLEEALAKGAKRGYNVFGKTYPTLDLIASNFNIDYGSLIIAKKIHDSLEKAIMSVLNKEPLLFEGGKYKNLTDLCNHYRISTTVISLRIHQGYSLQDAILTPIVSKRRKKAKYTYLGKDYFTKRELVEARGYNLTFVYEKARTLGVDVVQGVAILDNFFSRYNFSKDSLISRIPVYLYGEKAYETSAEFTKEIGTTPMQINNTKTEHNLKTDYEALCYLVNAHKEIWVDSQTGQTVKSIDIPKLYNTSNITAIKRGLVVKRTVRTFPNCTFNPHLYFATPLVDYTQLKDAFLKSKDSQH